MHVGCANRSIVATVSFVVQSGMLPDRTKARQRGLRIVLDDRSRLPGRFYGRYTASLAAGLLRAR